MERASPEDRSYFERIALANERLEESPVPRSLAEMFDRLERVRRLHGPLARPGVDGDDEGDLSAHLAFLEKVRRARSRGTDIP